ncbi:methyltransferase domain-containing protein [Paenibacillus sp. 1011MAR3C5]|uniref:class I SAM-dependent methyltransferase n=1 Tax=Paenibacillus sp. 1011MAR3C5 TaxID=1675787 RepID=UPI000E6BB722|nr:class I SAM-dependent methyltransferase [Paenibacillus sp. 1011MAR3C5]RJE89804.1 methyltransferase domain-containing protein [Paenibacillus sp. 1011MAR3C5]
MSNTFYEQVGVAMTCRGFDEYRAMFQLKDEELAAGSILDVAGGGSSFTAEARKKGYDAMAADPRYSGDIRAWVEEARGEIEASTAKLDGLRDRFDWGYYGSLENHRSGREKSLMLFAEHVAAAEGEYRYIGGSLPELPFDNNHFSLVLCSHFLFLYAEQFGYAFHEASIRELMRVCRPGGTIRVYPLMSLKWEPYEQLDELMEVVRKAGGTPEIRESGLPFIPGSDRMLHIVKNP